MGHLNLKSLTFYGVMIGSVLILFKAVTTYGESRLKAPANIAGIYKLNGSNLPDCLHDKDLTLSIEQSGIYIFGQLNLGSQQLEGDRPPSKGKSEPSDRAPQHNKPQTIHETIKLNGLIKSQPLVLAGTTSQLGNCLQNAPRSPEAIALNVEFLNPPPATQNLSGTLNWSSLSFDFGGTAQETPELKK